MSEKSEKLNKQHNVNKEIIPGLNTPSFAVSHI